LLTNVTLLLTYVKKEVLNIRISLFNKQY